MTLPALRRRAALAGVLALAGGMVAAPALADTDPELDETGVVYFAESAFIDVEPLGLDPEGTRLFASTPAGGEGESFEWSWYGEGASDAYRALHVDVAGTPIPLIHTDETPGLVHVPGFSGGGVMTAEATGESAVAYVASHGKLAVGPDVRLLPVLEAFGTEPGDHVREATYRTQMLSTKVAHDGEVMVPDIISHPGSGHFQIRLDTPMPELAPGSPYLQGEVSRADEWWTMESDEPAGVTVSIYLWDATGRVLERDELLETARDDLDGFGLPEEAVGDVIGVLEAVEAQQGLSSSEGTVHTATAAVVTVNGDDEGEVLSVPLMKVTAGTRILNTAPTIEAPDTLIHEGEAFDAMSGVTAHDPEDGDISDRAELISGEVDTATPGTYELGYRVTDSAGAEGTTTRVVNVNARPVINAPDTLIHEGEAFDAMAGVTAADLEDGDVSDRAEHVAGEWDTTIPGIYELTYRAEDSAGAETAATRTLTVNARPAIAAKSLTIAEGVDYDVMADVTAADLEDGDITGSLELISGELDNSTAGDYVLTYRVVDSHGAEATETRTVTVTPAVPVIPVLGGPNMALLGIAGGFTGLGGAALGLRRRLDSTA